MTVPVRNATGVSSHPSGIHKRIKRKRPPAYGSPIAAQPHSAGRNTPVGPLPPAPAPGAQCHVRWLIESFFCSKVLGSGGSRLRNMRDTCREPGVNARITMHQPGVEYRVFIGSGSALSISKLAGLVVKAIYDEPEAERSDETSRHYDLKMLVPQLLLAPLVGEKRVNLRDIEERSHAELSHETNTLPDSDEVVLHVFGVADAIQIALYYVVETLRQIVSLDKPSLALPTAPYEPATGVKLKFEHGRISDYAARNYSDSFERKLSSSHGGSYSSGSHSGSHSNQSIHNSSFSSYNGSYSGSHSGSRSSQHIGNNGASNGPGNSVIGSPRRTVSTNERGTNERGTNERGANERSANERSANDGNTRTNDLKGPAPLNSRSDSLTLPPLDVDPVLPEAIFMAYDIARESQRKQLRQIIHIDDHFTGSPEELDVLIENIHRVTDCRAELDSGKVDHFARYLDDDDADSSKGVSLVVEGPPEENMLALFLIHRYVKQKQKVINQ